MFIFSTGCTTKTVVVEVPVVEDKLVVLEIPVEFTSNLTIPIPPSFSDNTETDAVVESLTIYIMKLYSLLTKYGVQNDKLKEWHKVQSLNISDIGVRDKPP